MPEYFELYWKSLPTDLFTSQSKGSKQQARTEWDKIKPDKQLYDQIMEYTKQKEQVAREQRANDVFVSPWKHVCRLLKYKYWDDDLPVTKKKKVQNQGKCACGQPVDHSGFKLCWSCVDSMPRYDWRDIMVDERVRK